MAGKNYCTISNVTYLVVYVDLRKSITNTTPFSCCTNRLLLLLMLLLLLLLIFHRYNDVIVARQTSCDVFLRCQSLMPVSRFTVSVHVDLQIYQQIRFSTSTRATSLHVFQYIYFHLSTLYLQLYVSLSVCHIRSSNVAHHIYVPDTSTAFPFQLVELCGHRRPLYSKTR